MERNPFFSALRNKTLPYFYCSCAVHPLRMACHSANSHVFYRVNIAIHLMQLQPILAARWNAMLKQRSSLKEVQALKAWMALWIKKRHFELHLAVEQRVAKSAERGCKDGKVPPWAAEALAGRLWAHRVWLGAAASWAHCSTPNTFQMMNMMQTYWKKNIFLKRKTITSQSKTMKLNRRYVGIK